jgi:hypothetical protein
MEIIMSFKLEQIEEMIYIIRGQKVMLDSDLAKLYGVETKVLNQAIKRNLRSFPDEFMFRISSDEYENLRSQIVTSSLEHGGRRYQPLVFTANGVAMLSSVLKSETAIDVNIAIMRIFSKLRSFNMLEKELVNRMDSIDQNSTQVFKIVFERLDKLEDTHDLMSKERRTISLKN